MSIVISGVNNNDRITASDGTLDLLSVVGFASTLTAPAISATGNLTAASINVDNNIQLGTAGIVTATTFVGNVTGNINNSTLLLQTGGTERLRIDSNGTLRVQGGDGNAYLQLERYQNNDNGGRVRFVKSRSDTVGLNTIVQDGDTLGVIDFYGSDSNLGTRGAASISAEVDGTPGSADMPGRLVFKTVPDNSTVFTERLSINSTGRSTFSGQIFQSNTSTTVFPTSWGTYAYTQYPHELVIDNNATGTQGSFAGIYFNAGADSDGSKVGTARISAVETGNYNADLVFSTRNTAFTEKVRINSAGRVGIGSDNPTSGHIVDILNTSTSVVRLRTTISSSDAILKLTSGVSGESAIKFGDADDDDEGVLSFQNVGNFLKYAVNGGTTERLRIGPAGQIGILGPYYGEAGEVIRSRGINQAPEWTGYPKNCGNSVMNNTSSGYQYNTIPSYATKITVCICNLSLTGSNSTLVQLGTSSGLITSGYYSQTTNGEGSKQTKTDGFSLYTTGSGHSYSGAMVIYKVSASKYVYTYTSTNGVSANRMGGGRLQGVSGTIDRILITADGTNNFDTGEITIYAE